MTDPSPHDATASAPPHASERPLTVRLPVFEGPLDLLLHLIRKQQIDIKDIPIVRITEQYIDYLNLMKELNLDLAGEYLVMAATLIHIKSKMLLPLEPDGEEGEAEDPRAELVRQLIEYEKFKRAADVLYERDRVERAAHPRGSPSEFESEEETLVEASLFDLVAAFKELVEERRRQAPLTVSTYRVSVSERVAELVAMIQEQPRLEFRDLFDPGAPKEVWIVTFLALLEVIRMRVARILQRVTFGEILIVRLEEPAVPAAPPGTPVPPAPPVDGALA